MNYIKGYSKFKNDQVNEEFIGALIKGALGKIFNAFTAPWKDLVNDLKNAFKDDDPNSLRGIIMNNFNQAIDGLQKQLPSLKDDQSILSVVDDVIKKLEELAEGLDKDVETAFGKEKSPGIEKVAKAILIGDKENTTGWIGIVGLLNNTDYKYSKAKFIDVVNKGKDLKGKIDISVKFLENMQKDITDQLNKNFDPDELVKVYKSATKAEGSKVDTDVEYKQGDSVYYLLVGAKAKYDKNKTPEDQKGLVGYGKINLIDGDEFTIEYGEGLTTKKKKDEIVGKSTTEAQGANAKKAHEVLGKIKGDDEKMGKIVNYAEFIQNPANKDKSSEIDKILGAGPPVTTQAVSTPTKK